MYILPHGLSIPIKITTWTTNTKMGYAFPKVLFCNGRKRNCKSSSKIDVFHKPTMYKPTLIFALLDAVDMPRKNYITIRELKYFQN